MERRTIRSAAEVVAVDGSKLKFDRKARAGTESCAIRRQE